MGKGGRRSAGFPTGMSESSLRRRSSDAPPAISVTRPSRFCFTGRTAGVWLSSGHMSKAKGAGSTPEDAQNLPFEEALHRLEGIVEAMEAQDLPLETLLAKFEEGTKLAQLCQARLNDAEVKIQQLEKNAKGELSLKPAALTEPV